MIAEGQVMNSCMIPVRSICFSAAFAILALPASAAVASWTETSDGLPNGYSKGITDGNWKIGIKSVNGNWELGKYAAGSGLLDLRNVEADCGIRLVQAGNGAIEGVSTVYEVIFPDSVVNLDGATFKNCSGLTNVVLGASTKAIGSANKETFLNCKALKTINFPDSLEKIGNNAFQNCESLELTDFVLPVSVTTIGDHAFAGCKKVSGSFTGTGVTTFTGEYQFEGASLTSVSFPNSTKIPNGVCYKMATLLSAEFGSNISSIGFRAFGSCTALASVAYSGSIDSIGYEAFSGCAEYVLGEHTFPEELKTLGHHAFAGCAKLTGPLVFPGLETVGEYAFEGSGILTFTATNCSTIAKGMFNKCKKIESAVFSQNVTQLGIDVFRNGDSSLVSLYPTSFPLLDGTFGSDVFHGQKNLSIPVFDLSKSTVTTIGNYAFADCWKVGTIKLPETLTTLGEGSLGYNNGNLRAVWFYGPPPTTVGSRALMPKEHDTSKFWVLVAAKGHAVDWRAKVGSSITANDSIVALGDGEKANAKSAASSLGLPSVEPIGKWMHTVGNETYWNWVVVELPVGFSIVLR